MRGVKVPLVLVAAALFVGFPLGVGLALFQKVQGLDSFAHLLGGAAVGSVAYVIAQRARLRPWFPALQAFVFALAVGTLWEIGESVMHMQPGLRDTMTDLSADALGGLLAALWGVSARTSARPRDSRAHP